MNAILILAKTQNAALGLDADLNWVRLDSSHNILDVIDRDSGAVLRTADVNILQTEKFQKLFDGEKLVHAENLKIYKDGDEFICSFNDKEMPLSDARFYIDGYESANADIVILDNEVGGIFLRTSAPIVMGSPAPRENDMARIEKRMAEIYDIAKEYETLKSELVAAIKENNSDLKHTYEGTFFKAVYSPPGIRRTIDSDKLKAAGLYEMYIKESKTSPSVRIVKIEG